MFSRNKQKLRDKKCLFPGCGKEFIGHSVSKYCDFHRIIKNRIKYTKKEVIIDENNILIEHDCNNTEIRTCVCAVEGCGRNFDIMIIPKQNIYPKFCSLHRNPFKRKMFLESK